MNEQVQRRLAMLNAAWQRCASTANGSSNLIAVNASRREYVKAWESLEACGIAEWMLVYDPETRTFSLPEARWPDTDTFATMPMPAMTNQVIRNRERTDDPDTEPLPCI